MPTSARATATVEFKSPNPTDGPDPALTACVPHIDRYLLEYLAAAEMPTSLRAAIEYSLVGGGKRLRPVLAWHSAIAVGGEGPASLPAGAAVELIHAFSLVHDDLPGLDNDDLRRGLPTLHKHTSVAMAVLAGDAMLNDAFQLLVERAESAELAASLVSELASGTSGMIAGQVYDTLGGFPAGLADHDKLRLIHRHKTGALIAASCRMGALCGLAQPGRTRPAGIGPDEALAAITTFAQSIGLMFQIVDDIIDVTQTAEHAGKKTQKDLEAGKLTYPGVLGLDASRREVIRTLEAAKRAIAPLGPAAGALGELADYLAVRTK